VLPIGDAAAESFGKFKALLRRAGAPIGDVDLLIAGVAASRAYSAATSGLDFDDLKSLQMTALQDRANVVRVLDTMIAALRGLRDDVESENAEGLKDRLEAAREGRENWLNERGSANWVEMQRDPAQYPSLNERLFGSLIGRRSKHSK